MDAGRRAGAEEVAAERRLSNGNFGKRKRMGEARARGPPSSFLRCEVVMAALTPRKTNSAAAERKLAHLKIQ